MQKEWSTKTVLTQLDRLVNRALGATIFDADSPVRDETVGDLVQMLVNADAGLPVEIPGQSEIPMEGTD